MSIIRYFFRPWVPFKSLRNKKKPSELLGNFSDLTGFFLNFQIAFTSLSLFIILYPKISSVHISLSYSIFIKKYPRVLTIYKSIQQIPKSLCLNDPSTLISFNTRLERSLDGFCPAANIIVIGWF